VDGSAVAAFPDAVARRYTALGIAFENDRIVVAMADPANVVALDDIRSITGRDVKPVVGTRADILAAINRYHRADSDLDDLSSTLDAASEGDDLSKVREIVDDAPIVKFVNLLITQAVQDRASDIHIEPAERDLRVRFRIDGVLHEVMRSPKSITSGVTSRLKIMADINIAERRVPQDGRLSVTVGGKKIDLRVATLPTVWGEKVVMRILDNSTAMLTLADLGFSNAAYERGDRPGALGFLHVDGHVRVYTGSKQVPKAHITRMRIAGPATEETWVADADGDPVMVLTAAPSRSLAAELRRLLPDLRAVLGQRRCTVVFDRGGYSPAVFAEITAAGFDLLTYYKGTWARSPQTAFTRAVFTDPDGQVHGYELAERSITLPAPAADPVTLRLIVRRSPDGHQTPILTSRTDLSAAQIAWRMSRRWRQANTPASTSRSTPSTPTPTPPTTPTGPSPTPPRPKPSPRSAPPAPT